ncbi:hypothetical protein DL766_008685 [Monosporascus sp. MC13-8B]|uniref:AA1-like domain-containing protein n=1 Tax=Monosporascus cannonballus TaxID=155416 RepID=A0ABY0GZD9_9PEZI|nr:hypothetical protein DL762_007355 [Monosporascus cannonballus]RYO84553.1 hypothetical protein DL763_007430 [Monosporascus cannonballus]RYP18389.1 hypothetical protein DL766_008685 [Monosporascus sp. MC13-8B]
MRAFILTTALASLAAASQYGAWDVKISNSWAANGYQSRDVSATYTNGDISVTSSCKYEYIPQDHTMTDTCTEGFSYSGGQNDSDTIELTQTVEIEGTVVTVHGESAPLDFKFSPAGRSSSAEAHVEVSSAIA